MAKNIRTKYIKNLVADKDAMSKMLEESTKETLTSMIDETVNRSLRQMLSESDEDSYEEEVDNSEPKFNPEETDEPVGEENETDMDVDLESGDEDNCPGGDCDTDTEGDNVWDNVEDCKDSDDEYDLRGKDINTVLNIIQHMDKDDGVRIIKNDDTTATVEPDNGEQEFVIDITTDDDSNMSDLKQDDTEPYEFGDNDTTLDGEDGIGDDGESGDMVNDIDIDGIDDGDDSNIEFEVELGDEGDEDNEQNDETNMMNEGNVNLGYTDNYQKKSAMTMPNDKGESEGDSRFDNGAPKGGSNNKKRWVGSDGKNGGNPYSQKTKQPMTEEFDECGANECGTIFEVEMDVPETPVEETHTRGMARTHNSVGRKEVPSNNHLEQEEDTRNTFIGASQKRNTSRNSVSENVNRKLNAILEENKQLKEIANQLKEELKSTILINTSLAKATKLMTENSTSRDEKINILNRFNKVQSLKECKNLYNQISEELKKAHSINNGNLLNKQLTEVKGNNKNMIVETNMLNQSEDLSRMIDLNNRLMNLGK